MVVAQLVERLLPTPEVRGSNPLINFTLVIAFVDLILTLTVLANLPCCSVYKLIHFVCILS